MKIKEVLLGLIIGIVLLMFLVFGTKLILDKPEYEDYCNYSEIYKEDVDLSSPLSQECNSEYDYANEIYSKNMFLVGLILGVLIITFSTIFIHVNSISGGIMFGGSMFLIYGTGSYWRYMDDLVRFFILGICLGALIYLGYWLNKREDKKARRKKRK